MTARVWVTRDEGPDGELCAALRAAGLTPVCEPVIERRVTADVGEVIAKLAEGDWLVLTSPFAIESATHGGTNKPRCRLAVVGEASRRAAERCGLKVDLVGPDGTGAGLWTALAERLAGARTVCYPRSSAAAEPPDLPGVSVSSPVFYEMSPREFDKGVAATVAAAAITSPSAARAMLLLDAPPPPCASIGSTTSAALRRCGIEPWLEAPEPSLARLAAAIADALTRRSARPGTTSPNPSRHT